MSGEDKNLNVDVEILRRDIDRLGGLFDRIDITIEKLTEVSNSINRMLAVHENRLSQQEEITRHIFNLIEERRKENRDEFREGLKNLENKIDKLSITVVHLDRWKYLVVGGGVVLGYVIAQAPLLKILFGS